MKLSIVALALGILPFSESYAAELFIRDQARPPKQNWREMDVTRRLNMLARDSVQVELRGKIVPGDYSELLAIHNLVPIETFFIASPGGSVAEALKIAQFVNENLVLVDTDYSCDAVKPPERYCGCASACALVWLSAPVRSGIVVKLHRPYFDSQGFPHRSDSEALAQYNALLIELRSFLEAKGYSREFVDGLFRIPRESERELHHTEIAKLPIDVALDELLSARCYRGNEVNLSQHSAVNRELVQAAESIGELTARLPDRPGMELEKDPLFRDDYRKLLGEWRRQDEMRKLERQLAHLKDEFENCKREERIQISLRKSGERLSSGNRATIAKLADLFASQRRYTSLSTMAKILPNDQFGHDSAREVSVYLEQIRKLSKELRESLPLMYLEYITAGPVEEAR